MNDINWIIAIVIFSVGGGLLLAPKSIKAGKEKITEFAERNKESLDAMIQNFELSQIAEDKEAIASNIRNKTAEVRKALSNTYFAGQQKTVNDFYAYLDGVEREVGP